MLKQEHTSAMNMLLTKKNEPIRGFILDDGRAFIWTTRRVRGSFVSVVGRWNDRRKEYVYQEGTGARHDDATQAHERAWNLYNEARTKVL